MPTIRLKYKERILLACTIENLGVEMSPCSFCERNNRKCIVDDSSKRCSKCVRHGASYNVEGPSSSDIESMLHEMERLNREDEEAMAKILHLRK